jgi:hypothetical protein
MGFQFVVIFIDSFMHDVTYVRDGTRTEEKLSFCCCWESNCTRRLSRVDAVTIVNDQRKANRQVNLI